MLNLLNRRTKQAAAYPHRVPARVTAFILLGYLLLGLTLTAWPSLAYGQATQTPQSNLQTVANYAGIPLGSPNVPRLAAKVINIALGFIGSILLIIVLYAGFLWMTAAGSEEKVGKAKKLLASAVIGLMIILAGYGISRYIMGALQQATGTPLPPMSTNSSQLGQCSGPVPSCPVGQDPVCTPSGAWTCAPSGVGGTEPEAPCAGLGQNCDVENGGLFCCEINGQGYPPGTTWMCAETYPNSEQWRCLRP